MFKGFSENNMFNSFLGESFGMNGYLEAFGAGGCSFWLSADLNVSASNNLEPVSSWSERVEGMTFEQASASLQPRLILSDVNFGGNPVVDFTPVPRLLQSPQGIAISSKKTVAFVYQYNTFGNTTHWNSSIVRTPEYGSPRSIGSNFGSQGANSNVLRNYVGYYRGANLDIGSSDVTVFNTAPVILLINEGAIVANGVSLTPQTMVSFINPGFVASVIGGPGQTFVGSFKLAEWIVWEKIYSVSECLEISTRINDKYAIY